MKSFKELNLFFKPNNILSNIICYETINKDKLNKLLISDLLIQDLRYKNIYDTEYEMLLKYISKINTEGKIPVKYIKKNYGRSNPENGYGLHNIRREIRHTLSNEFYIDIDVVNCHPVILHQILIHNKIECKYLTKYIENRNDYLNKVMETYNLNKDKAKILFISLLYGGSYNKWLKENNSDIIIEEIQLFNEELWKIGDIICDNNKELNTWVLNKHKDDKIKKFNYNSSTVSYYLQEKEVQILEALYLLCIDKGYIINNNCVLCADGIMLQKELFNNNILNEFQEIIKLNFDIDLTFTTKKMDSDYSLDILNNSINIPEIKNIINDINIITDINIKNKLEIKKEKLIKNNIKEINNEIIKRMKKYQANQELQKKQLEKEENEKLKQLQKEENEKLKQLEKEENEKLKQLEKEENEKLKQLQKEEKEKLKQLQKEKLKQLKLNEKQEKEAEKEEERIIKERKKIEKNIEKRSEKEILEEKYKNDKISNEELIYNKYKLDFESKFFKISEPIIYGYNNNDKFKLYDYKNLNEYCIDKYPGIFTVKLDNGFYKDMDFFSKWRVDEEKRTYNKVIFNPNLKDESNEGCFNLFSGFKLNDLSVGKINTKESAFFKLLKHLCNGKLEYKYIKEWIAHIIRSPEKKTNVAIVLYSKIGGVGKNALIDCIIKLLKGYTGKIESIDDITNKFNDNQVNKLFIYGDEISCKAGKYNDKLKSIITRTEITLEKKGHDAFIINDYSNWMFTTNNELAFKIEEGSRRMFMVECNSNRLSKEEFIEYYNEINDPLKIQQIFNYFLNYEVNEFDIGISPVPNTNYKCRLEFEYVNTTKQYLYKQAPESYLEEISGLNLYENVKEYAKKNFLSIPSMTECGKIAGLIFLEDKKKTNKGIIYNLNNIINRLIKYDDKYYNYIYNN